MRILVVDDDLAIRQLLAEVLETAGYIVQTAINGRDALARLHAADPDVILTDLRMPVMDGWSFIGECRGGPAGESIPIIVMSAHAQVPAPNFEHRVQGFVEKPFDIDTILRALAHVIRAG